MTKFRATDRCLGKVDSISGSRIGYCTIGYSYPNEKYNPEDPDTPKTITVMFGPLKEQGEVVEADIPDKYAKGLLRKTLEPNPYIVVVPTTK